MAPQVTDPTTDPTPTTPTPTPPPSSSSPPPSSSSQSGSASGSTTPSSTSSAPSSSGSSVNSSSSTSTTSSIVPTTAPPSTSFSLITSNSGGVIVTRTSTTVVSADRPGGPTISSSPQSQSKPFFKNTGAVAGVFTVVGLIALALVFALITNIIRRRRAKAFDRELQEATREAAAAPAPAFLDDDDDDGYGRHGSGAGYNNGYGASSAERQFSDLSHGTYGQTPMGHTETYNMRELGPGTGVGEIYDPYGGSGAGVAGAAAGAAGIGIARARSMKADPNAGNPYGAALADGASPYAAFAGPQGGYNNTPAPLPGAGAGMGGGDPFGATAAQKNLELLEAAGMGSHIVGAGAASASLARSQSQYHNQQPPQQPPQGYGYPQQPQHQSSQSPNEYEAVRAALERGRSLGSSGHSHEQPLTSASTGAPQYYSPGVVSPYDGASTQSQAQQTYNSQARSQQPQHQQQRWSVVNEDMEDAYGGYSASTGAPATASGIPNPFSGAVSTDGHTKEWDRESRSSAYSQEEPKRVLKVANE